MDEFQYIALCNEIDSIKTIKRTRERLKEAEDRIINTKNITTCRNNWTDHPIGFINASSIFIKLKNKLSEKSKLRLGTELLERDVKSKITDHIKYYDAPVITVEQFKKVFESSEKILLNPYDTNELRNIVNFISDSNIQIELTSLVCLEREMKRHGLTTNGRKLLALENLKLGLNPNIRYNLLEDLLDSLYVKLNKIDIDKIETFKREIDAITNSCLKRIKNG